ncbi:MAG: hypothetical protein RLP44_18240 [Aggregatilineales bacterium]
MPYEISWYIENEIIYARYSGVQTVEEVRQSLIECNNFIARSPRHLVHVISDVGDITKPLRPVESLKLIREVGTHARLGWTIILYEKSILIKMGVAFGTAVFKSRNRTYKRIEDAIKFMKKADAELSWDKVTNPIQARTR